MWVICILTLRLNDNFDKSRLGVITVCALGGGDNERFDDDKRGRSDIWIGNDFRTGITSVFIRNFGLKIQISTDNLTIHLQTYAGNGLGLITLVWTSLV